MGGNDVSNLVKGLLDVVENVFAVLYSDGQADEIGSYAGLAQLLVGELAVRMARGMQYARAGICHVRGDVRQFQRVHEADSRGPVTFQPERYHAARAVGKILLGQFVALVAWQSGIVYPCHAGVVSQEFRYALRVLAVALHAQMERLQTHVEQEGVHGGGN